MSGDVRSPGFVEARGMSVPVSGRGPRKGFLEETTSKLRCDSKRGTPEHACAEIFEFRKKSGRCPLSRGNRAGREQVVVRERLTPPALLAPPPGVRCRACLVR